MHTRLKGWLVVVLLLGTMVYAIAEELTLTTYYPSPRGVYHELRTAGDVKLGDVSASSSKARLEIRGRTALTSEKALYGEPEASLQVPGLTAADSEAFLSVSGSRDEARGVRTPQAGKGAAKMVHVIASEGLDASGADGPSPHVSSPASAEETCAAILDLRWPGPCGVPA